MEVKQLSRVISSTGKIHQNQEVWSLRGGLCTLKATHYKDAPKVLVKYEKQNKNCNSNSRWL